MKKSVRHRVTWVMVAAVCALGLVVTAPAIAAVVDPPGAPGGPAVVVGPGGTGIFVLTVAAEGSYSRRAVLACRPTAGTHPAPRKACDQLRAAGGHISRIPAASGMCTTEYAPVTVTATGVWRTGERHYHQKFSNGCHAVRDTGGVLFNF